MGQKSQYAGELDGVSLENGCDVLAELEAEQAARSARLVAPAEPLFGSGEDYTTQAFIDDFMTRDTAESVGFQQAAQELLTVVQGGEGYRDTLVFPIVFCYRQYLELALKRIVRYARACGHLSVSPQTTESALKRHSLDKLWKLVLQALERCDIIKPDDPRIIRASRRIEDWKQHDPDSFAYRYSRSIKEQKRVIPASGPLLNILQFVQGMNDLAETIDELTEMYDQLFVIVTGGANSFLFTNPPLTPDQLTQIEKQRDRL